MYMLHRSQTFKQLVIKHSLANLIGTPFLKSFIYRPCSGPVLVLLLSEHINSIRKTTCFRSIHNSYLQTLHFESYILYFLSWFVSTLRQQRYGKEKTGAQAFIPFYHVTSLLTIWWLIGWTPIFVLAKSGRGISTIQKRFVLTKHS